MTKGIRYILTGFIDYGNNNLDLFLENYQPIFDGYGIQAGFHNDDIISSIEVCHQMIDENGVIIIEKRYINVNNLEDIEWIDYVSSCEKLLPNSPTNMIVKRFLKSL